MFEDDFPFPKVGYVNSLEGIFGSYNVWFLSVRSHISSSWEFDFITYIQFKFTLTIWRLTIFQFPQTDFCFHRHWSAWSAHHKNGADRAASTWDWGGLSVWHFRFDLLWIQKFPNIYSFGDLGCLLKETWHTYIRWNTSTKSEWVRFLSYKRFSFVISTPCDSIPY